jgi:hypothetical protein
MFVLLSGMAIAQTPSKFDRATIGPSIIHLQLEGEQQFKVVMVATRLMAAGEPNDVRWAVNDIPGGSEELGTIDHTGLYRAPSTMPSPREIHICAEVPQAANRFLWATVIIGDSPLKYRQHHIWSEPVIEGTGATAHLESPHGIGLDADGNILIADQKKNAVLRYTAQGEYMGLINSGSGRLPGEVSDPRVVVSDAAGDIYVRDGKGDRPRMQVFNHAGEFQRIFAPKGILPGMILRGHGIGFGPQNRLYVVDVDNMRVNVYEKSGEFLYDWGTEGLITGGVNAPHGLFVDRNGDVFVNGYYGPTQKFNSIGDYLLSFCHGDPPDGPVFFHNMTGDRWGNAYVMVRTKSGGQGERQTAGRRVSIMKYNNNGDFVAEWAFTAPDHRESTAVVDADGKVYALFTSKTEMGVEIFIED